MTGITNYIRFFNIVFLCDLCLHSIRSFNQERCNAPTVRGNGERYNKRCVHNVPPGVSTTTSICCTYCVPLICHCVSLQQEYIMVKLLPGITPLAPFLTSPMVCV